MGWFGSGKDKRKVKALIVSDSIKEFIGAVAPLVNEAKLKVSPTGITIRAVDPAHVGMIEVTLTSGAFAKLEAEEMELGMDVTKFESVIAVAKPGEMIDIERDTEMNRLVVKIGSLVEVVPLDMAGMADFEVPNLDFPAMVKVKAEEITQMLKTSKKASDNIELSANKESFRLVGYSGSDIDRELTMNITMNRAQLEELKAPNETASTFSLEYFSLMVNSVEKDRILTISLGNDFPVKIEADLAVDENTGPQGSVFFLLSPRIESPTAHLEIEKAKEREEALDYDAAIRIWEELGYTKEAARVRKLKADLAAPKTEIHGDYVDDRDTTIQDSVVSRSNVGAGGDGDDLTAKLQQLAQMHRGGILSDEQFEAAKNKLLN